MVFSAVVKTMSDVYLSLLYHYRAFLFSILVPRSGSYWRLRRIAVPFMAWCRSQHGIVYGTKGGGGQLFSGDTGVSWSDFACAFCANSNWYS